jgi:hypothetical protein
MKAWSRTEEQEKTNSGAHTDKNKKTHKKGRFRMAKSDHLQGESNGSLQQQEHT